MNLSCKVIAASPSWQGWLSPPPYILTSSRDAMEMFKRDSQEITSYLLIMKGTRGDREELSQPARLRGPFVRTDMEQLSVRYFPHLRPNKGSVPEPLGTRGKLYRNGSLSTLPRMRTRR